MSNYADAQLAIETRFQTQWADQDVALRYENEKRQLPSDNFIRLVVRSSRSEEIGYSGPNILYRRYGIITAQCFVLPQTGTQKARELADAVAGIFEGQSFSGITCRESEVVEVGDDGNGFYQVDARVYFDHDFERTY